MNVAARAKFLSLSLSLSLSHTAESVSARGETLSEQPGNERDEKSVLKGKGAKYGVEFSLSLSGSVSIIPPSADAGGGGTPPPFFSRDET